MSSTIRLHRVFKAPPERVYRAFLEPAAMAKWLPPYGFTCTVHQADGKVGGDRTVGDIEKRRSDRWNFLFIAGMWFQDLFNYDFRRTEMCIIPYGTQEGEISFCAYNTGIGWRNIIENMHQNATVAKWYQEHGRHEIFAGGKDVELADKTHGLILNEIDLTRPNKPQMEGPKTAHEEAVMMRKLYQEMVLNKQLNTKEADKPVQIKGLSRKKQEEPAEAVLV